MFNNINCRNQFFALIIITIYQFQMFINFSCQRKGYVLNVAMYEDCKKYLCDETHS